MATRKPEVVKTTKELKRLEGQSKQLRLLTSAPRMKSLSPKRHDKLLRQLEKVDRSIAKITKIVGE